MRRREFITLAGGAAAWPLAVKAQPAGPVVGYLHYGSPELAAPFTAAFLNGLRQSGYIEGRNVAIEYRWAHHNYARLLELATDLVRRRVAVIAVPFFSSAVAAAKAATSNIPIVFSTGVDPVQAGFVASFNRPGGNVTGVTYMSVELVGKRFGLLHALLPAKTRFGVLVNRASTVAFDALTRNTQAAAEALGRELELFVATNNSEIDQAFARIVESGAGALIVNPNTLFLDRRVPLATLAARYGLPTIYPFREHAEAGGLMSYGASVRGEYRDVGIYTGRILNGEKAAELPVMQPTKYEFVVNLHTARALGIEVPPSLQALADEVIE